MNNKKNTMQKEKITPLNSSAKTEVKIKMQQALSLYTSGRLKQAEWLYGEVLKIHSNNEECLHYLGIISLQSGRPQAGIDFIKKSIEINSANAIAYRNLAGGYMQLGDHEAAVEFYEKSIFINPSDMGALLNMGLALAEIKRNSEAIDVYGKIISLQPSYWKAFYNRGLLHSKLENTQLAENDFRAVISINSVFPNAYRSLGVLLHKNGLYEEALENYRLAIKINPDYEEAYHNCGVTMAAMNLYQAAIDSYDRSLKINPNSLEGHFHKGIALNALSRHEEALDSFAHALEINPNHERSYYNCGLSFHELKDYNKAIDFYNKAISIKSDLAEVYLNKAIALSSLKNLDEAMDCLACALKIKPDYAEAYNHRAAIFYRIKLFNESIEACKRAIAINPVLAGALNNYGLALYALNRSQDALEMFDRAIVVDADFADAHFNRGHILRGLSRYPEAISAYDEVFKIDVDYNYALGYKRSVKLLTCDWTNYHEDGDFISSLVGDEKLVDTPFSFLSTSESAEQQLLCAKLYADDNFPALSTLWKGEVYAHNKIRIAYVSADFREHPTSYLLAGLIESHDREKYEIYAISLSPRDDSQMGERMYAAFDYFTDVSARSDEQVAQLLRTLEIDIAVDLMGFTQNNRTAIFSYRAAPVQINYLGYPGSMGVNYIDYIIADKTIISQKDFSCFSEKIVHLPDCFQVNDSKRVATAGDLSRALHGLPDGGFVFCTFNGSHKINPNFFSIWMRLLHAVPGSVLWLVDSNAEAKRNLQGQAVQHGIEAERLIFAPKLKYADHLARIGLADLFLDSLPFGAGATASDALFAGLPVLTCLGGSFSGRMAASLLNSLNLPELIVDNLTKYENLALELASAPEKLQELKEKLHENKKIAALFDTDKFRNSIETAYDFMHERSKNSLPPVGFSLS